MANKIRNTESNNRFNKIFDFDFKINRDNIPKFIPFVVFLSFLILTYIAIKYYAEEAVIEQSKLKKELKDLRAENLTIEAELVDKTKRSEVSKLTEEIGLNELVEPPKKVIIDKNEY